MDVTILFSWKWTEWTHPQLDVPTQNHHKHRTLFPHKKFPYNRQFQNSSQIKHTKLQNYRIRKCMRDWIHYNSALCTKHFEQIHAKNHEKKCTRMHSSRMRTVRNSSRLLPEGSAPGGEGVSALGRLWGAVCSRGVCSQGVGGGIPACTEADPPVNRMTNRCKNITFATSLRTVKTTKLLQK